MEKEFEFEKQAVDQANEVINSSLAAINTLPSSVRRRAAIELKRRIETEVIDYETQRLTSAGSAMIERFATERSSRSDTAPSLD